MNTLRRIFYLSRAVKPLTDAEVQSILRISQRNNRRSDITGCLMYSGEYFAQTIEGRHESVDPLVARIALDPRHADLRIAIDEDTSRRLCPDWSMGLIYSLDLAERLTSLATNPRMSREDAYDLMERMKADSMMGPL